MVSALVSGSSGPGSSHDPGHCVVFLGNTLYFQCLSQLRCMKKLVNMRNHALIMKPRLGLKYVIQTCEQSHTTL